jgi:hypothetical protein
MKPASPAAQVAACGRKLAGSIEGRVGATARFLPNIEQNTRQIFQLFEEIHLPKIRVNARRHADRRFCSRRGA